MFLLINMTASAQEKFEIKGASKNYDARLEVEKCGEGSCRGDATFALFRKGASKPFQIVKIEDTEFMTEEVRKTNSKQMYSYQSVIFFEDYNFDGREDLAVRDGNNGGYGGPTYKVYLFSPQAKRFVYNAAFTDLAQGVYLGMFHVDKKKKTLRNFSKSGCCWHEMEEFAVIGNRLKKVLVITEDATVTGGGNKVKITTRRLVGKRWRASVKYERLKIEN
jgi:hypothetical protein